MISDDAVCLSMYSKNQKISLSIRYVNKMKFNYRYYIATHLRNMGLVLKVSGEDG